MPQMFQYCGQRFQVYKRAHKTCDTVSGAYVGRRLPRGVHLEHRCDGQAYGGCQAGCLIFWKEAWLKPVAGDGCSACPRRLTDCRQERSPIARVARRMTSGGRPSMLHRATQPRYSCQATELLQLHRAPEVVGCEAVCGDLSLGQRVVPPIVSGGFYLFYYYDAGEAARLVALPAGYTIDSRRYGAVFRSPDARGDPGGRTHSQIRS